MMFVLLFGGAAGLPPGERDAALLNCPPKETLLYAEWAERTDGKMGAAGVDGLIADPEVVSFLKTLEETILKGINDNIGDEGPEAKTLGNEIPKLIKILLKRPGCLYIYGDDLVVDTEEKPVGDPEFVRAMTIIGHFRATIIVNAGDEADAMEKSLVKMLSLIPNIDIDKLDRFEFPVPPFAKVFLHREGERIIVTFGEGTLDMALKGLSGTSNGLKDSERFQASMKRVAFDRTASTSWLDISGSLKKAVELAGPQGAMIQTVAQMISADAIDSLASSTGVVNGNIQTKSVLNTNGKVDGLLALAAGRGIKPKDLEHIPGDSDFTLAISFDAGKVLQELRKIVGVADADSLENLNQGIKEIEQALELSVEDDLLKAFGHVWTAYDSPSSGGVLFSMPVLTWEVTDKEKAQKVYAAAMQLLEAQLPGINERYSRRRGVIMTKRAFMDHTFHFINTIGDDDVVVAPTFCLTDTHLLIGLHPQSLKSHIRHEYDRKNAEHWHPRDYRAITGFDKGDVIMVGTLDTRRFTRLIYSILPYIGQSILSDVPGEFGDITVFELPSANAILPYVSESWTVMTRTENGLESKSQSGLPFASSASPMMSLPTMLFMSIGARVGAAGEVAPAPAVQAVPF